MIALLLYLAGLVPSFHDWPHRSLDGTCRCRGSCCTRVRPAHLIVHDVHWLSDHRCFPGEYRPVLLPVIVRRPAVVPWCRRNRYGHITWPVSRYPTASAAAAACPPIPLIAARARRAA